MSFTNAQLAEISRYARLPEGQLFVQLLQMRLAEHDRHLRTASGEELFRTQGKAQAVQQLIDDIEQAGTRLQRAQGSRSPTRPEPLAT